MVPDSLVRCSHSTLSQGQQHRELSVFWISYRVGRHCVCAGNLSIPRVTRACAPSSSHRRAGRTGSSHPNLSYLCALLWENSTVENNSTKPLRVTLYCTVDDLKTTGILSRQTQRMYKGFAFRDFCYEVCLWTSIGETAGGESL